jgi:hypothetical protein
MENTRKWDDTMKHSRTFLTIVKRYGPWLCLLVVPLLIAADISFPSWQDYNDSADSIAGVWISTQQSSPEDNVWIWTETLTPLDDTGMRYA